MDDECIGHLIDPETRGINHGQAQRICLSTQVGRPTIHLRIRELGLPARSNQSRAPDRRGAVQQDDSGQSDMGPLSRVADE
jgi:hypothetical protein